MASRSSFSNIIKLSIPIFFANLAIPLVAIVDTGLMGCLLYTSPSPREAHESRMPSSA